MARPITRKPNQNRAQMQKTARLLEKLFDTYDVDLKPGEIKIESDKPVEKPGFPYFMMMMAVFVDVMNFMLELTIVLSLLSKILSLLFTIILLSWLWWNMGGLWWKKRLLPMLWRRFIPVAMIEILPIPLLGMVPMFTIFVWMTHNSEKKYAKIFNDALEILHGDLEIRVR